MKRRRMMYRATLHEDEMGEIVTILKDEGATFHSSSVGYEWRIGPYRVAAAAVRERFDLGRSQWDRFIMFLLREDIQWPD